jgi:hypothetical protein
MTYGLTAKNSTNLTQTYSFTFGEQITPGFAGAYSLHADLGGSLTSTDGSVTITPLGQALIQSLQLSTDNGATYFNAGVDVGPIGSAGSGTSTYGPHAANVYGNTGSSALTDWRFQTQFQLTAQKDVASLSGSAILAETPEPAIGAILATALSALGALRVRRRQPTGPGAQPSAPDSRSLAMRARS